MHKPSDPSTMTGQTQYDQRQLWMSQTCDPKGSIPHQMETSLQACSSLNAKILQFVRNYCELNMGI